MLDAHMFFKMVLKRPRKNMLKSITQNAQGHRDSWYSAIQLCKVLQTIFLTVLKDGDRNSLHGPMQRKMDILGWSHSLRSTAPPHSHLTFFHHPLPVTILFLNNELLSHLTHDGFINRGDREWRSQNVSVPPASLFPRYSFLFCISK